MFSAKKDKVKRGSIVNEWARNKNKFKSPWLGLPADERFTETDQKLGY